MRRATRRIVLAIAVAAVGSALVTASAAAEGGIDGDMTLWGQVDNVTPYTFTLAARSTSLREGQNCNQSCWQGSYPPQTVQPGQSFVYGLGPYVRTSGGAFNPGEADVYDGWVTYKADVLGGPTEYVTIVIVGTHCTIAGAICSLDIQVLNTSAPPPPSWDPETQKPGVPNSANPQVAWTQANPYNSDVDFQIRGNFSVDAGTTPPALVDVLNNMCNSTKDATCSFTQTAPLTWGVGQVVKEDESYNCKLDGSGSPGEGSSGDDEPDWVEVAYETEQSASLTVGGGLSASTETELFGVIGSEITVDVEAEHEWTQTKTLARKSRIFLPENHVGQIWVAPTQGIVKGTLVVSNDVATYTITNFAQTRSGVSRDALTPAFDVITQIRPMTDAEYKAECLNQARPGPKRGAGRNDAEPRPPVADPPPTGLMPGRGVRPVKLGHTEAQVAEKLGNPLFKSPTAIDCKRLDPRCKATAVERGTWVYPRISVVFGADARVTTVIYKGRRSTRRRAGVGTGYAAFRRAHPGAGCTRYTAYTNCRIADTYQGHAVTTVFHFIHKSRGRKRVCDRVMIYAGARAGQEATT